VNWPDNVKAKEAGLSRGATAKRRKRTPSPLRNVSLACTHQNVLDQWYIMATILAAIIISGNSNSTSFAVFTLQSNLGNNEFFIICTG